MKEKFEIGQIVNTFGIKGFVKVKPWVNDIERFDDLKKIYVTIKKESKELEIEEVKYHKGMVLIKFKGIETIEQAEMLRNAYLEINREDAIPLEEGTYFIADLLESDVYSDEGEYLGKLEDIYNTGAKDIYVVKNELGKTILLPGIPEVIKEVDLEKQKITVHLLKGLV
ncbi:MAG: 16S rRNA processing protein RimM [Bacilli bacterium]|nr:16S rRNA processing protein RimM [Bacilli bacterium]